MEQLLKVFVYILLSYSVCCFGVAIITVRGHMIQRHAYEQAQFPMAQNLILMTVFVLLVTAILFVRWPVVVAEYCWKRLHRMRTVVGTAMLLVFLCATGAAQQDVRLATTNLQVLNAVSAATISAIVPNVAQSAHELTFCTTGSVTSLTIQLEARPTGTAPFSPIAPPANTAGTGFGNSCGTIEAGGYYADVRVNLVAITGTGTLSAWYSATNAPIPSNYPAILSSRIGGQMDVLAAMTQAGFASGNSSSYVFQNSMTNPSANNLLIGLFRVSPPIAAQFPANFRRLIATCTAACTLDLAVFSAPFTCNHPTPFDMGDRGNTTSMQTEAGLCAVDPSNASIMATYAISDNQTHEFDLSGFRLGTAGDGMGIFLSAGLVGKATASIEWYER